MDLTRIKITKGDSRGGVSASFPAASFLSGRLPLRAIFRDSEAPVVGFRGLRLVSSFRAGRGGGVLITRSRCQSR